MNKNIEKSIEKIKEFVNEATFVNEDDCDTIIDSLNDLEIQIDEEIDKAVEESEENTVPAYEAAHLEKEIEELEKKVEFAIPVKSVLDATKAPILQRMFQNLSIEQLEEVENFARSTVKHPAKYIEYIHEN